MTQDTRSKIRRRTDAALPLLVLPHTPPACGSTGRVDPSFATDHGSLAVMTIQRICGLSLFVSALALATGCTTTAKPDESATAPAPAATQPAQPAADVAVTGADTGANLSSEAMAADKADADAAAAAAAQDAANKANQAALDAGVSVVRFPYDSDAISDADMDLLRKHAAFLKANPTRKARLEGHTDERGTQEYNLALGERRGKAVAVFLQSQGVNASQFEVVSFGELKPVASGEDESAWAQNRRVEIIYR